MRRSCPSHLFTSWPFHFVLQGSPVHCLALPPAQDLRNAFLPISPSFHLLTTANLREAAQLPRPTSPAHKLALSPAPDLAQETPSLPFSPAHSSPRSRVFVGRDPVRSDALCAQSAAPGPPPAVGRLGQRWCEEAFGFNFRWSRDCSSGGEACSIQRELSCVCWSVSCSISGVVHLQQPLFYVQDLCACLRALNTISDDVACKLTCFSHTQSANNHTLKMDQSTPLT